ncbi:hypothetical protein FD754_008775 [Muntiacus muntjak]|uniref:Uncharacterized protein n=1 Tax=Muntiacus muntjak TaxID=9888 RepID=A0A5N3WRV7_MUNMU|nr:hypothetical protein FD754_008775 [Muntiacus muntjak]
MASRGRKRKARAALAAAGEAGQRPGRGSGDQALRLQAPELAVKVNPARPRRGSFEKGPPRKLKLPEPHVVLEELKK